MSPGFFGVGLLDGLVRVSVCSADDAGGRCWFAGGAEELRPDGDVIHGDSPEVAVRCAEVFAWLMTELAERDGHLATAGDAITGVFECQPAGGPAGNGDLTWLMIMESRPTHHVDLPVLGLCWGKIRTNPGRQVARRPRMRGR